MSALPFPPSRSTSENTSEKRLVLMVTEFVVSEVAHGVVAHSFFSPTPAATINGAVALRKIFVRNLRGALLTLN